MNECERTVDRTHLVQVLEQGPVVALRDEVLHLVQGTHKSLHAEGEGGHKVVFAVDQLVEVPQSLVVVRQRQN